MFEQSEKCIANPEEIEENRCRICYDSAKPLISVCNCGGSIAYVHEECILDWMTTKIQTA
jgi:E3 ubiquitin-protein ligase DOA10